MSYVPNREFLIDVSLGKVPGHSLCGAYGISLDISSPGNNGETIWNPGGNWTPMLAARQLEIVSTSPDDNIVGSGAQALAVQGSVVGGIPDSTEIVPLNGTTPVVTNVAFFHVQSMRILTSGTGGGAGAAAGTITATAQVEATLQAQINSGGTASYNGFVRVPELCRGVPLNYWAGLSQSGNQAGGMDFIIQSRLNDFYAPWVDLEAITLDTDATNQLFQFNLNAAAIPAGTAVQFIAGEIDRTVTAFCGADILIVQDGY